MNLIIKLPPKEEREDIIDAWIDGLLSSDYEHFSSKVGGLINDGFSTHGITCLVLHETTTKVVKNRITDQSDSPWIDAAFEAPISLN